MGINIELWRVRIGSFSQPGNHKLPKLQTLKSKHAGLYIRLVLFLLLAAQCIETIPGPLKSGRGGRSRASTSHAPEPITSSQSMPDPEMTPRPDRGVSHSSQASMQSWLNSGYNNGNDTNLVDFDSNLQQLSGTGVSDILLEIRNDVKSLNRKFDSLSRSVSQLQIENKTLMEQNVKLENTVFRLSDHLESVKSTLGKHVKKQEKLELYSRKINLNFYGIQDSKTETPDESEHKVREFLSDRLDLNNDDVHIETAHRIQSQTNTRPIIVRFGQLKCHEIPCLSHTDKSASRPR